MGVEIEGYVCAEMARGRSQRKHEMVSVVIVSRRYSSSRQSQASYLARIAQNQRISSSSES